MYQRPLTIKQIEEHYPSQASSLLTDPVHKWRAETGIELIHPEPTSKEQQRIWKNWQQMSDQQKTISDQKSLELFGIANKAHHYKIMNENY